MNGQTINAPKIFRQFESSDSPLLKLLRSLVLVGGLLVLAFTGMLELTWPQQIVLGILMVAVAVWLDRSSSSYVITLTLLLTSAFSTFRYGFWRYHTTVRFFRDPGSIWNLLDAFFLGFLSFALIVEALRVV